MTDHNLQRFLDGDMTPEEEDHFLEAHPEMVDMLDLSALLDGEASDEQAERVSLALATSPALRVQLGHLLNLDAWCDDHVRSAGTAWSDPPVAAAVPADLDALLRTAPASTPAQRSPASSRESRAGSSEPPVVGAPQESGQQSRAGSSGPTMTGAPQESGHASPGSGAAGAPPSGEASAAGSAGSPAAGAPPSGETSAAGSAGSAAAGAPPSGETSAAGAPPSGETSAAGSAGSPAAGAPPSGETSAAGSAGSRGRPVRRRPERRRRPARRLSSGQCAAVRTSGAGLGGFAACIR